MSVADFVVWNDGTPTRYELVRGAPVAMAPPTPRHTDVVTNLNDALSPQLKRPCRVAVGGGVARRETDDQFRIPDAFVTCEPTPSHYYRSPRVIIEVLSPSTEREDRTDKLDFYRSIASVEMVIFIWQDRRRVQTVQRVANRWSIDDLVGGGTVELPSFSARVSVDQIYRDLDVPDDEPPTPGAADRRSSG